LTAPIRLSLECLALAGLYGFVSYYAFPLSRGNLPLGPAFWSRTGGSNSLLLFALLIGMIAIYSLYLGFGPPGTFARVGLHLLAAALGSGLAFAVDFKSLGYSIYLYPFIWAAGLLSALAGVGLAYLRKGP
jgi:hypothetical protein